MSDIDTAIDRRYNRRQSRPERIDIGDDVLVRNDLVAEEEGVCVRTLNRGDAKGDPHIYVGNVKYRPIRAHREWRANQIIVKNQKNQPRRRPR
jgi:hypothetical protein